MTFSRVRNTNSRNDLAYNFNPFFYLSKNIFYQNQQANSCRLRLDKDRATNITTYIFQNHTNFPINVTSALTSNKILFTQKI